MLILAATGAGPIHPHPDGTVTPAALVQLVTVKVPVVFEVQVPVAK